MSFRLFRKRPSFFEFFREQNRIIVEAATVLNTIVLGLRRLRRALPDDQPARGRCDALNRNDFPAALDDLHHAHRPRGHSPDQFIPGNHSQPHPGHFKPHRGLRIHPDAVSGTKDGVQREGHGHRDRRAARNAGKQGRGGRVRGAGQASKGKSGEMLLLSGLGELTTAPNTSPAELMEIIKWTHVYDRIDKAFNRPGNWPRPLKDRVEKCLISWIDSFTFPRCWLGRPAKLELTGLWMLVIGTVAAALVFDAINGFHDAANSIATVVFDTGAFTADRCSLGSLFQLHRHVRVCAQGG